MSEKAYGLAAASRELFIKGMRQVASSVAVVTTNGSGGRHGATVSAFTSVSADPPQLLACLRSDSRIAAAVNENGSFCLNILSHQHPHLAERFSGQHDTAVGDRFEGIEIHGEAQEWVVLKQATAFCCAVFDRHVHATHTIFLGNVLKVQISAEDPLTYLNGQYRRLAR
ncbi:flavin reductase family protein [Aestuariivirga sp.]|uniref:flavin reductase family protein n=1 Tax=Aestuariivirga sp. TaxID=2650926 RepID=UPI003BAD8457